MEKRDGNSPPPATVSGLLSTVVVTLIIAIVYVTIFLILRRTQRRFYAPRTYLGTLPEQERTPALPTGLFNWIGDFWKIPDTYVLQHQSIDSYLFLRYLRMLAILTFVGCLITWPILFPVNATGGAGQQQLDILSFSNVDTSQDAGKNRLYAHLFVGWIFYMSVLFLVCRESIFYINLRQAFLLSSLYSSRVSARTVLFTSVPEPYLNESVLRRVFGASVKNIWITRDTTKVDELVKKRDEVAYRLEGAETKLIKMANKERLNALKKGAAPGEAPASEESGSVAARWIPDSKRPTHKLGLLGLYGEKVDSINWSREQLQHLIPETEAAQTEYRAGSGKAIPGVFIEFNTQSDAQSAFQTLSHHQALQMSPRYIGVNPNEVLWGSLQISWWQKVVRRYAVLAFITAMIVFWAIPVSFVGLVSNVNYLETYSWLAWLKKIPPQIMGIITNLLPSVALAILMSLVPVVMRLCARLAGEPSLARVELFTQNAYFAFQVIQVFLVVTLSAAASSLISGIIDNPSSTPSLLANNLPKASNLYISYFVLQGLTIASGVVSQVVGFIVFKLLYKFLSSTPRSMYQKWINLSAISWGSILPVYSNIAVIAITYAMISPLILGFATIALALFYLAYRYNILFVTNNVIDTKGLIYPRALQHLLTGVYLSEICLIGLFGIATSIGPLILMVIFTVFTALFHISMNSALDPLLYNLPRSLVAEEENLVAELERNTDQGPPSNEKSSNGVAVTPASGPKPGMLQKIFMPHIYSDYATLRRLVPHDFMDVNSLYTPEVEANAYFPPSVTAPTPLLWIPKDEAGVSTDEIAQTSKVIGITDDGASLDEKNNLVWDPEGARPPIWEDKVYY